MIEIRAGESLLYSPILAQKGYVINSIKLTEEINKAASLTMTIPNVNRNKDALLVLKPEVKVYKNGQRIFRGRVASTSDDFYRTREIRCEGELAYLRDAILRPSETHTGTVAQYFSYMIGQYNAKVDAFKRFTVGSVTVTGESKTRSNDQYPDFLSELTDKLLNEYGGAFRVRCVVENGSEVNYIDYLADAGGTGATGDLTIGSQPVRFAKNLLDMVESQDGSPTFTAIVPLGAIDNQIRLTIKSVNSGSDFLENTTASAKFGRIESVRTYDAIKSASELKAAGQTDLDKATGISSSIEVKAVDLSFVGESDEPLITGKKYRLIAPPNTPGITEYVRLNRSEINLLSPDQSVYTFGAVSSGITAQSVAAKRAASAIAQVALLAQDQATQLEETVGPLKAKVDEISDYITARNTSAGWNWDSYKSGRVEIKGTAIPVTWGSWLQNGGLNVATGTVTLPTTLTGSYAVMCSGSEVFLSVYSKTGTTITLTAYSTGTPTESNVDLYIVK